MSTGQPTPLAKKRPPYLIIGIVSGVLLLCCVVGGIAIAAQPSSKPTVKATATTGPTPTPIHWVTIDHLTGSGTKTTDAIPLVGVNVSQEWRLVWSCDPASVGLNITVLHTDGSAADLNAVDTDCSQGHTSGTAIVRGVSGNIVLHIISEGVWTVDVEVQGLP
jgi:hypothetical protein